MTATRERGIEVLSRMPEEELPFVIDFMENMERMKRYFEEHYDMRLSVQLFEDFLNSPEKDAEYVSREEALAEWGLDP
jgi:hypothetical protein